MREDLPLDVLQHEVVLTMGSDLGSREDERPIFGLALRRGPVDVAFRFQSMELDALREVSLEMRSVDLDLLQGRRSATNRAMSGAQGRQGCTYSLMMTQSLWPG